MTSGVRGGSGHPCWSCGACVLAVAATLLAGCGGKDPDAPPTQPRVETTAPRVPPKAASPPKRARFNARVAPISAAMQRAMTSWHRGCPTALSDLRVVAVTYEGFDRVPHTGRLVLNKDVVRPVIRVMRRLYIARFPIRRMRPVEAYGSNDDRSMDADNTSAFNCRGVPGSTSWSQHAYGRAVDINPRENPEVRDGVVSPRDGRRYLERSPSVKGLIVRDGAAVRAFRKIGWGWGGAWHSLKDYQHFSATGT